MFDDFFDDGFFTPQKRVNSMRCDIKETDNDYKMSIELPGFKKEDITINLDQGYLNISANTQNENEEKNDEGHVIRKERYSGSMSRSFYVGDQYEAGDFNASFDNGELNITIPKKDAYIEDHSSRIPIE
ncbi:hypothetical protein IV49_GL002046 [Kandleria vitulina DSM 20405]|uniref:SHSP domain-containing protein n=2 Tax=Kandleria vitulina TaxID=1630 RepID=A0A0R2HDA4_9FIRM|nr:hypothetical protein IV49_GL002046 [Kandleria vitulina DSM 20405]